MRDRIRVRPRLRRADTRQREPFEVADEAAYGRAEREAVTPEHPYHADYPHRHDDLHDRPGDVLLTDESAVEERQAGDHQQDERRTDEDPSSVR